MPDARTKAGIRCQCGGLVADRVDEPIDGGHPLPTVRRDDPGVSCRRVASAVGQSLLPADGALLGEFGVRGEAGDF
ncbi:MAG TPA: hypothetical protein PKA07_04145, partial [Micropruina sp.]|nr:hypothetical protein [Micropruina sp.]